MNKEDFTDKELKEIIQIPIHDLVQENLGEGDMSEDRLILEDIAQKQVQDLLDSNMALVSAPKPILQLSAEEEESMLMDLERMGENIISSKRGNVDILDASQFRNFFAESLVAKKIGSAREKEFRDFGEGTGDIVDLSPEIDNKYSHLIFKGQQKWGGYRFKFWKDSLEDGTFEKSYNASLYNFSEKFKENHGKRILELTRMYGGPRALKYSLAALQQIAGNRRREGDLDCDEMAGSATISSHFEESLQRELVYFMQNELPEATEIELEAGDITPKNTEQEMLITDEEKSKFSQKYEGLSLKDKYTVIERIFKEKGERFPALFKAYVELAKKGYVVFDCAVKNFKRSSDKEGLNFKNPSIEMFLIVNLRGVTEEVDAEFQKEPFNVKSLLETFKETKKQGTSPETSPNF